MTASRSQPCGAEKEPLPPSAEPSAKKVFSKMIRASMPTEAEMRATSLRWIERIGPTLIDRWPADVLALSMPTKFIPCPAALVVEALWGHETQIHRLGGLADDLDAAMGWDRHFIRLNSRSPKDAAWPFETPATCSGKEAISMLASSERALDDLCSFRHIPEHPAYICLREFVPNMRPHSEYRCFVKDGQIIAVTHYDYLNPVGGPEDGGKEIRAGIEKWFAETLAPRLHVQTVVFDLYLPHAGEPLLIELNPYGLSDPCWLRNYEGVEHFSGFVAFADAPAEASPRQVEPPIRDETQ